MEIIKTVTTVFDVLLILIFLIVSRGWKLKQNKSEIIGMSFMSSLMILNIVLMWI